MEFVLTEAANRVEYLKANKVDIIFANFTVTPERKEVVDFAKPYLKWRSVSFLLKAIQLPM